MDEVEFRQEQEPSATRDAKTEGRGPTVVVSIRSIRNKGYEIRWKSVSVSIILVERTSYRPMQRRLSLFQNWINPYVAPV